MNIPFWRLQLLLPSKLQRWKIKMWIHSKLFPSMHKQYVAYERGLRDVCDHVCTKGDPFNPENPAGYFRSMMYECADIAREARYGKMPDFFEEE